MSAGWHIAQINVARFRVACEDPALTIDMTVWESIEQLPAFAYRNLTNRTVMRRRAEWFVEMPAYLALWWVRAGSGLTWLEGQAKLELIGRMGPTAEAFDFRTAFAPSD